MALPQSLGEDLTSRRIRMARAAANMTLREMASAISGYTGRTISHEWVRQMEIGNKDPGTKILRAISAATGESLSFLNGESDEAWPGARDKGL